MTNEGSTSYGSGSDGGAQSLKSEVTALKDKAAERVVQEADSRKGDVAGGMKQVSSALQSAASELDGGETPAWLRQGVTRLATSVSGFAEVLENTDARELTAKVQDFARRSPGTFLGACAAAGFAASRVFTAGRSNQTSGSSGSSRTAQSFGGSSTGSSTNSSLSTPYGQDADYRTAGSTGVSGTNL